VKDVVNSGKRGVDFFVDIIEVSRDPDTRAGAAFEHFGADPSHLLRAIDEALVRMRRGTYGVCEMRQQPISKPRLEAVPWARHCRDCKELEYLSG
jgi:RNA polymerase-binding transcription factor DksA